MLESFGTQYLAKIEDRVEEFASKGYKQNIPMQIHKYFFLKSIFFFPIVNFVFAHKIITHLRHRNDGEFENHDC